MSVLGVYEWVGINSILPELWVLPECLPFHPSRWWCHCRMVYLPMAYIYANKIKRKETATTKAIKDEIFTTPYNKVNWIQNRSSVSELDDFYKSNKAVLKICFTITNFYERHYNKSLRKISSDFLLDYIRAEDLQTDFVDIGPVNKALNTLSVWHAEGKDSSNFKKHAERMWDYVWIAEDGMKMQGYNGSQLWDTAFAVMAILKHPNGIEFSAAIRKAYDYIKKTQVDDDVPYRKNFFRHRSKDMWPFSTKSHGWPISDCTSHALESVLLAHEKNVVAPKDRIPDERLKGAAKAIIAFQNEDGGYPTYEPKRGSSFLEYLNPAATFGKIMVDYSYVELTSSAVCALCLYAKTTEDELADGIRVAVGKAVKYIKSEQREDGSWYGSWGICFTYAIFFAVRALVAAGERNCREINKATQFLLGKQREDGGWGESYKSAETKEYVQLSSQVVNTSWALIALMEAGCEDVEAIERGIDLLMSRQTADGDWEQEQISGVFNANCMITYTSYRNVFPVWALSLYAEKY